MVAELITKYIWLIQTFIKSGENGLSLEEIQDKWEEKWDSEYSRKSFCNHRKAIEDIFYIKIECNRSTNRYFIRYSEDAADENSANAWIINTFSVNSMLSLSKERLSGRVSVENIPSGQKWLTRIIDAMQEDKMLSIGYKKYTSADPTIYTIRPYGLREYEKRWYLIGFCNERKAIRVYSLDRIDSLEEMEETFIMPENFDLENIFSTCYSIYLSQEKGKTITFKAFGTEVMYLRDLPLHHSQKEIKTTKDYSEFSIFVVPDEKLIMDFCSRADRIEVLTPNSVREKVRDALSRALQKYI